MFRSTAHVYDLVYELSGKDYRAESVQLESQIRQRAPTAKSLLDVGCGTGGHLVELRQSFEVAGIDLDAGMLEEARARLDDVELVEADMRSFHLGRSFDAVLCLFSSIGYLGSASELADAVSCMAEHLSPGGVLIVDGWIRPEAWQDPGMVHVVSGQTDGVALARVGRSHRDGNRTILELHHLLGTVDGVDHLVDRHELTLFADDEYLDAFARAGLEVEKSESPFTDRDRYVGVKGT